MREMTFARYEMLLDAALRARRSIGSVLDHLEQRLEGRALILRHDVDRRVEKAVRLAELEHARKVRASYYFRSTMLGFPVDAIRRIASLGHEIGYHYETLSRARGDKARALSLFKEDLAKLRAIAPVKTACKHGAPLSPFDNGDLLRQVGWRSVDLVGDAFLSFEGTAIFYLTDTGGAFGIGDGANLRDRIDGKMPTGYRLPQTIPQLIGLITELPEPIYLSLHPERWSEGALDGAYCTLRDLAAAGAKRVLKRLRGSR